MIHSKTFVIGPAIALAALSLAPSAAIAQQASESRSESQAELAEARAIIDIMLPPATRQKMLDDLTTSLMGQLRQAMLDQSTADAGLKAIRADFFDRAVEAQKPLLQKHMPAIIEAMAVAYSNEFSMAELKDIHAFAMTPSGGRYLSRSLAMATDPAVRKVNAAMIADSQKLALTMFEELKARIAAYLEEHPEADGKSEAGAK